MKIEELFIGALVLYKGEQCKVVQITHEVYLVKLNQPQKNGIICNIEYIEPIPFTYEILFKNGFKKDAKGRGNLLMTQKYFINIYNRHEDEFSKDMKQKCQIRASGRDWIVTTDTGDFGIFEVQMRYFKYVHELQSLLRLAGINKEIVL